MDLLLFIVALVIVGCVSADNRMQIVSLEHYMSRNGDCPGRTISKLLKSDIDMCASECDKLPNCRAFLYVPDWSGLDDSPYCELKYATCNALTHGAARHYHFYDKFVNFIHYTRRYGRCLGNTIKVMRATGLMRCQAECDRLPHCTGFTFSLGRHDIRRLPQCELKYKSCSRPVFTSSREIQTYDKIENATIPLPDERETTPVLSTVGTDSDNSTDINDINNSTTVTDDDAAVSGNLTEVTTLPPPSSSAPAITDLPTIRPLRKHYQYFLRPGDCPGSNINQQPLVFKYLGKCHYACDKNPKCVAYHLILPTEDSDNMTRCYLKWDTCEETSAFSISRLQFYDKIEVEIGYMMKYGKCSDSGATAQFYTVDNVTDCRGRCDLMIGCAGFDYRQGDAWMGKKSACHLRSSPCKILVANPRANYDRSYERITIDTGRMVTSASDDVTAFIITGVALTLAALVMAAVYVIRVRRKLVNPHQRFDQVNMPTYENEIPGQSPRPSQRPSPGPSQMSSPVPSQRT